MIITANFINITLDTVAPSGVSINIAAGATYTTTQTVVCTIATTDTPTTGYQMLLWGDIDSTYDVNVQPLEANSTWIAYSTSQTVKLSATDGSKTVYLKVRDDVFNTSSQTSDVIVLDTTVPTVTVGSPDLSKISKIAGKNVASFNFTSDSIFTQYKVKVVPATNSLESAGVTILTTNGSTNMSGTGTFAASTPLACTINGSDLEVASAGDGSKIIKVFVLDQSGLWST